MKKSILIITLFFLCFTGIYAQSLAEIVSNQSKALKEDLYDDLKTLKITGNISQMGMSMGITIYYKEPDKSRVVISFNGQEIVQFFDGLKAYVINPMAGNTPQELPADQASNLKNNSSFRSPLSRYLKENKLTLEGKENVNNKPAFKIKVNEGGNTLYFFIDQDTWLPVKTTVMQGGINVETFQEWGEVDGLILPKVSKTKAGNMEIVINIEKAEKNIPLEDSLFKL